MEVPGEVNPQIETRILGSSELMGDSPENSVQYDDNKVRINPEELINKTVNSPDQPYRGKSLGLGFYSSLSVLVGLVVGSGIFSSPGPVYEEIGSFYGSVIVWIGSGLLSMLGALSYGELGAAYPKAGGEHVYLYKAFGSLASFLFSFTGWITRPTSVSVISLSLSEFLLSLIYGKEVADGIMWPTVGLSILLNITIVVFCIVSKSSSKWVQNVLCVLKLGLLLVIGLTGIYYLIINNGKLADTLAGKNSPYTDAFATGNVGKVAKSFYLALWGYDGWSNLNLICEEMVNPARNIPLVLGVGILLISVFYVFTNTAYFAVLNSDELMRVNAISPFAQNAYGSVGRIVILILVCLSSYGALNSTIFCNTEVAFVAASDKYAPKFLSKLYSRFGTPANALLFQALISVIISLIFQKNYNSLVTFYSLPFWVFYAGAASALIYLRKKDPGTYRPFKVPIFAPVIFIISTIFMIVFSFFEAPYECIAAMVLFLLGVICWYIFVHRSMRIVITQEPKALKFVEVRGIYAKNK